MIIRLVVDNFFSFGTQKEFNTIPNKRLKTLNDHKYSINEFEFLKTSSIYGANGAGKSNLIKALEMLQSIVVNGKVSQRVKNTFHKFTPIENKKPQTLAIEFIQNDTPLYYGLEILDGNVITEELYISGLGISDDKLIFERKNSKDNKPSVTFLDEFEHDEKSLLLKSIILEEFLKPNETILKFLSKRENEFLKDIKLAYSWFRETLQILTPDSKPSGLAHKISIEPEFKKYAQELMCSFNIGITSLSSERKELNDFFKDEEVDGNINDLREAVEDATDNTIVSLRSNSGSNEVILYKEDEKIWVEQLKIGHNGKQDKTIDFDLDDESDGTVRLLDFAPAFQDIISNKRVYVIDEIERSIHPLLIKELVKKFSLDNNTNGQLIFTTHESNLLDQEIFRQDEIWFAEKDLNGSTDLYSLSDFKEHKTIDIRKGYLNGRYGSIPFTGNLEHLNWHQYDFKK